MLCLSSMFCFIFLFILNKETFQHTYSSQIVDNLLASEGKLRNTKFNITDGEKTKEMDNLKGL